MHDEILLNHGRSSTYTRRKLLVANNYVEAFAAQRHIKPQNPQGAHRKTATLPRKGSPAAHPNLSLHQALLAGPNRQMGQTVAAVAEQAVASVASLLAALRGSSSTVC